MKLVLAIVTASLFAFSTVAKPEDEHDGRLRHPAGATQLHVKVGSLFGKHGMAVGPGIGLEFPLFKHLSLGGQFNTYLSLEGSAAILDFDVFAKGVYRLRVGGYNASVYGMLPLGLSMMTGGGTGSGTKLLFNLGVLPGFSFYFNRHWGIFTELGIKLHIGKPTLVNGEFGLGLSYAF